ncbi:hypothetical protein F5888DRAFT_1695192 [Russula emetica]|nr:hypothetical protein F5888DRAFT_1695192 [Russula emetica]
MRLVGRGLVWNGPRLHEAGLAVATVSLLCSDWAGLALAAAVGQRARTQERCSMADTQMDHKGRWSQLKVHVDDAWGDDEKNVIVED